MRLARRIIVIWAIDAVALWLLAQFVPGLELQHWFWAIWAVAAIGLLNALVRPFLLVVTLPFTVLSLGLLSIALNAIIVLLAQFALPGFAVADFIAAIWVVLGIAAINTLVTGLLSINDDESFYRNVTMRLAKRSSSQPESDVPGIIFLEIDGLSEPALRRALEMGLMPTVKAWLDNDDYRLVPWNCGVPSQTSSSQAGILYGRNFGIPAFRWYEKQTQELMISNRPWTAAMIHERISDGTGLLAPNGTSLTNLVSGDAGRSVMTMSSLMSSDDGVRQRTSNYFLLFLNPYSFSRTLVLMVWELLRELGQRFRGWLRNPRQPAARGGSFAFLRAISNVYLRDLNLYLLVENMLSGTPVVYSTFLGYDVVAHHAGPYNRDSLLTLRQFDADLRTLLRAAEQAPRPYRFVLLSDHGQSPGATFEQRFGLTFEQLVDRALGGEEMIATSSQDDEGWGHVNALLSQTIRGENVAGRAARRVLRRRTQDGYVELGPISDERLGDDTEVVVCTSGNLGLIYFTELPERSTLESLTLRHPKLIETLVRHPGIDFLMLRSEQRGAVIIGKGGVRYLETDEIHGVDPLVNYGSESAAQLRRIDQFPNVGDIVVNSCFDPKTGDVAAFEDLVGSHGGLGGDQTNAFLLYPSTWPPPGEPLIGAEKIYPLFRKWVDAQRGTASKAESQPITGRSPVLNVHAGND